MGQISFPIEKRNKSLVQCKNWPTGGALYPQICFVCVSNDALDGSTTGIGWMQDYLNFRQTPSSGEILN